jgi:cysteinyl-tRNA synthetase
MSSSLLGKHFDIHGGGQDLQFPHHENEIAQSEGAHAAVTSITGCTTALSGSTTKKCRNPWATFFTIREVLEKFDAEVVRFFILRAHYRSPLNYSDSISTMPGAAWTACISPCVMCRPIPAAPVVIDWNNDFAQRFAAALNEDFDSHGAISILFELAAEANRQKSWRYQVCSRRWVGHRASGTRPDGLSARRRRGRWP